jgi:hypothetical protein
VTVCIRRLNTLPAYTSPQRNCQGLATALAIWTGDSRWIQAVTDTFYRSVRDFSSQARPRAIRAFRDNLIDSRMLPKLTADDLKDDGQ